MMDSLAEQVPGPVMMYTRLRFSVGSGWSAGRAREALRRRVERRGRQRLAGDRIAARVLVVEHYLLERAGRLVSVVLPIM